MIGKLSFLLTLIVLVCASCSSRYYIRRGNVIYETGRYYKAETKYDKAFNKAGILNCGPVPRCWPPVVRKM